MTELYDLHCHSTASDGELSPTELVKRAAENTVTTLALTDHDTTDGLAEAKICADELNINFINGIELSIRWEKQCLHILGLNIEPQNEALQEIIIEAKKMRQERAEKIAVKLEKKGVSGAIDFVKNSPIEGMITRSHFAHFLVSQFHVSTLQEAFDRYLGDGKSAYVSTTWTPLETGVEAIHAASGIPVVAHPLRYKLTATRMKKMLGAFKNAGGLGMEIVTGRYNPDEMRILANYASQFELAGSMGSDFHSSQNKWIELGRLAALPDSVKPVWELWQ
jgi:predicted metal-dependent phosphoesterase TrpH